MRLVGVARRVGDVAPACRRVLDPAPHVLEAHQPADRLGRQADLPDEAVGAERGQLEVDRPVGLAEADDRRAIVEAAEPGVGERPAVRAQRPIEVDHQRQLGTRGLQPRAELRARVLVAQQLAGQNPGQPRVRYATRALPLAELVLVAG